MWSLHLWHCFWPWLRSQRRLPGFPGFRYCNEPAGWAYFFTLSCMIFWMLSFHLFLPACVPCCTTLKDRLPLRRLYLLHLAMATSCFLKKKPSQRHRPETPLFMSFCSDGIEPFGVCTGGNELPHWHVFRGRFQTRSCVQDPWNQLCPIISYRISVPKRMACFWNPPSFPALHSIRVTGIIFNFGGNGQLTAGFFACVHYGLRFALDA